MSFKQQSLTMRQTGFTLIEIMVVVVIVAILSSAVVPMMMKNNNDILEEEANRFEALIKLAQDEAILQNRQLGLKVKPEGKDYFFLQLSDEDNNWIDFAEGPFRPRTLPSGTKSTLNLEEENVFLAKNSLDEDGNKKIKPQVFLLSSGEITPFNYTFFFPTGSRIKVTFDAVGNSKKETLEKTK